ncbi:hypothetical protein Acor_34100 [Acrocarpospora corrugata]|uniref:MucB/RseB N-terminal domain-containing protein n=1 Tax=Acrocarpospora corrugata TaxID=35763 RepID=A0A5M3VXT6_9ACTN|nr:hypothetical protein [Acrocarpospora corrugata]GES01346.1 hypothetical protein Acor_34100 [Acrocarpospora corrugata]
MDEREFRALLIKATDDRPPGLDPMPVIRRKPARVLIPALTTLAVAAAVSLIVLVFPGGQPSAQAQVIAAIENTGQESYRIHTTSGAKTFEGAFDPAQHVGVITRNDGAETRFIGDLVYIKPENTDQWTVAPRDQAIMEDAPAAIALVKLAPLDPQEALQELRSATDVHESGPATGTGWTGQRYTLSLADAGNLHPAKIGGESMAASGLVDVDDQGRVRHLEVTFTDNGQTNILDISDFGTPVTVTAPPADQTEPANPNTEKPISKDGLTRKPIGEADKPTK